MGPWELEVEVESLGVRGWQTLSAPTPGLLLQAPCPSPSVPGYLWKGREALPPPGSPPNLAEPSVPTLLPWEANPSQHTPTSTQVCGGKECSDSRLNAPSIACSTTPCKFPSSPVVEAVLGGETAAGSCLPIPSSC